MLPAHETLQESKGGEHELTSSEISTEKIAWLQSNSNARGECGDDLVGWPARSTSLSETYHDRAYTYARGSRQSFASMATEMDTKREKRCLHVCGVALLITVFDRSGNRIILKEICNYFQALFTAEKKTKMCNC